MSRYRGKLRTDGRTANGKFIGNSVFQYYLQIRLLIKMKNKFYTLSNAFNVKHTTTLFLQNWGINKPLLNANNKSEEHH